MMKCESLCHEFKKYEGQPVKVYTDDGRTHTGISLACYDDAVRILDRCGRIIFIEFCHIDAVVEPMMKLHRCCRESCCEEFEDDECREERRCREKDRDDDCGCDGKEGHYRN